MGATADPAETSTLLLTRFAIRWGNRDLTGDDAWLRRRADLFEKWTLPSVRSQTWKGFRWWLLVHSAIPAWLRRRAETWKPAKLRFYDGPPKTWQASVDRMAKQEVDTPRILTARLDSDDALAAGYFESCWNKLRTLSGTDSCWLIHQQGYWYDGRQCHVGRYPWRQFGLRYESVAETGGVYQCPHGVIRRHGTVIELPGPGWLTVIHGGNLQNKTSGWQSRDKRARRPTPAELARDFPWWRPST